MIKITLVHDEQKDQPLEFSCDSVAVVGEVSKMDRGEEGMAYAVAFSGNTDAEKELVRLSSWIDFLVKAFGENVVAAMVMKAYSGVLKGSVETPASWSLGGEKGEGLN